MRQLRREMNEDLREIRRTHGVDFRLYWAGILGFAIALFAMILAPPPFLNRLACSREAEQL